MTTVRVAALEEPTERVPVRWVAAIALTNVALFTAWFGPIQVLLGREAEKLAPQHKEAALGVVVGVGAAFAVVASPVFGALSDRTTSRFGRRLPWVVGGGITGVLCLLLVTFAPNLAVLTIGWCLVQLTLNASFAAIVAVIPDRVPHRQRGMVGGWFGIAQTVGIVAGAGLAAATGGLVAGYLACIAVLVLLTVPFLLIHKDSVLDPALRPVWSLREFVRGFWIDPRRYPDFGWAWLTRFLINLGNSIPLVYLLYYLQDAVHYSDPDSGVLVLTATYAVTLLLTVVVGGIASDRLGRRKVFVLWSGVVMSIAALILAGWQSFPAAVLAAAVLGLGFGVYTSVDFALLTEVLPHAVDRAKDLGMINFASTLPQVLAPAIAAPVVTHLGGYPVLYTVAAALGLLGAVLVYRIRAIR
jgi:MFS family permease